MVNFFPQLSMGSNVGAPLAGALNNLVASDNFEPPTADPNRAGASPAPTKSKSAGDIEEANRD